MCYCPCRELLLTTGHGYFRGVVRAWCLLPLFAPASLFAGGPKYVAGVSFFNPAVVGQPVHWAGGQVNYYVDQGPLNSSIDNQQATAMVDAAAALWSAVPTAGVTLGRAGSLNEDVNGANIVPGNQSIAQPSDAAPSATSYPLAVIFDSDGAVLDAVFGAYTSDPSNCETNGVMAWIDNFNPDATIAHAVLVLNGRCAVTPESVIDDAVSPGARPGPHPRARLRPGQSRRAPQWRA